MTARELWTADMKQRGRIVTRWPANVPPSVNAGKLASRPSAGGAYALAPFAVRATDAGASAGDSVAIAKGKAAQALTEAADASGLSDGAFGVLAKMLGIPRPALVLIAVVLVYAMLANAGLLPPLPLWKRRS